MLTQIRYSFNTADFRIIRNTENGISLTNSEKCEEDGSRFIEAPLHFFDGNPTKRAGELTKSHTFDKL